MFDELALDHAVNLIYVALVQGDKDRLLVREVLIDRADAHPRNLGNPVRRDSAKALTLQDSYNGIEYRLDCLPCTPLLRTASP